jgi:hypothetical protein
MRSAGCVINDYADRDFDGTSSAPANRPLAGGAVEPREALLLAAVLAAVRLRADPAAQRLVAVRLGRALPRRELSLHQALLRDAAGLPRRRLRLRHPDGLRRGDRHGAGEAGCCWSPTSSGRWPTTPSTPWSTARTTSRSASAPRPSPSAASTSLAVMICYAHAGLLGRIGWAPAATASRYLGGWWSPRGRRLPLHADPRPRSRRLLQGLPPQQLVRRGDLRRHRRRAQPAAVVG